MAILTGVGVALVTPFHEDDTIDFASLGIMIEHVIRCKVDYIVTLGTTGEPATLTEAEKIDILQFTYEKVNNRVPVVVGLGGNNTAELLEQLTNWPLGPAAALLSVSPYYNKPSQEGLYHHYAAIAQSTRKQVLLYNVPGRTASNISVETTLRLAADFENIIGIKEASGNMVQCMHLARQCPEGFLLLSGDDHLALPLIALGFHGVISVAANCFSAEFSQLVHAALDGNFGVANDFQHKLLEGFDLLFAENNPAGVKAFLSERGLVKNQLRLPLVPLSQQKMDMVRAFLV